VEKKLEAKELSFLSLPYLSLQDVQDLGDEATINEIEPTYSEKEKVEDDKYFEKKNPL